MALRFASVRPLPLPAAGGRRTAEIARALGHALRADLPADVRRDEVTVAACFRASLLLNALTGGRGDMTFSARLHGARLSARSAHVRLAWSLGAAGVDLACAVLRGESAHCETAWRRHCARRAPGGLHRFSQRTVSDAASPADSATAIAIRP